MSNSKKKAKEQLNEYVAQLIPEVRNPINTLQPMDYNPYERIGPLGPNEYSYWNNGQPYNMMSPVVSPEG